jgi:CheY-like chemotaxis protein
VPVTILVADDSATMRSILEMTFAGEDARVVTVDGGAAALEKALDLRPDVVLADLSMEMDGYEVARAIKSGLPGTSVVVMASQHTPYDEAKGRDAGVDDHIVKPFDTQGVIDRVTRLATGPRTSGTGTISGVPPAHPYRDASSAGPLPAPPVPAAFAAPLPFSPPAPPAAPRTGVPRTTVAFGSAPIVPPVPVVPPVPAAARPPIPGTIESSATTSGSVAGPAPVTPPVAKPATTSGSVAGPAPVAPAPAAPPPAPASPAAVAVSAAMSEKLSEIGLTPQQAEAVLALSREVVERVVWEVVPELAETIIREEIKRLTAAG